MKKLLAVILTLAAFGMIIVQLRLPTAAQVWRIAPRADGRSAQSMSIQFPTGSVNVNTASFNELDTLPGVGKVLAQRIVEEREENGPFHYPEDLLSVPGIGQKTLNKLLHEICIP